MSQRTSTDSHGPHSTSDRVSDLANQAKDVFVDTLDQHRDTGARVLATAASTIHDGAARVPSGERVIQVADAAADQLDAAADYVRTTTTSQMTADLRQLVKRYPGRAILIAAAAGMLVGRGFRKR